MASEAVDDEVLRLRGQGFAFARISRDLGLARAAEAQHAFRRAVRRLPAPEATQVRHAEASRLDRLADRVRSDDRVNDEDRDRQLRTIARLRKQLDDDG